MKVWTVVVVDVIEGNVHIEGVFSDKEEAKNLSDSMRSWCGSMVIESTLDKKKGS